MLSDRSQVVMSLARNEASRLCHEYLGTEHILLGIAKDNVGVAADTLNSFGIHLDQIRTRVEQIIGVGPPGGSPDDLGMSSKAKRALSYAEEEADQAGLPHIEPEHLLIGVAREVQGIAAQVLRDLQTPPEIVRARVKESLDPGQTGGESS